MCNKPKPKPLPPPPPPPPPPPTLKSPVDDTSAGGGVAGARKGSNSRRALRVDLGGVGGLTAK